MVKQPPLAGVYAYLGLLFGTGVTQNGGVNTDIDEHGSLDITGRLVTVCLAAQPDCSGMVEKELSPRHGPLVHLLPPSVFLIRIYYPGGCAGLAIFHNQRR